MGSAIWAVQAGVPYGWSLTDVLIADVYHALVGEPHPLKADIDAKTKKQKVEEQVALLVEQRKRLGIPVVEKNPPSE